MKFMTTAGLFLALTVCASAQELDLVSSPIETLQVPEFTPARNQKLPDTIDITPLTTKSSARAAVYDVGDTPPVVTSFYWANQGGCIVATNPSGTLTMFHPGAPGLTFNWCFLGKPLPPPPYTVVMGVRGHLMDKAQSIGLVLYDVYTNKFVVHSIPGSSDAGTVGMAAWRMNSFTAYAGSFQFSFTNAIATGGLLPTYVRFKDNGTTRTVAISHDKEVWLTISAVPSGDFMTPNFAGYALRGTGNNLASMFTIYHESITTP